MKNIVLSFVLMFSSLQVCQSQEWMTSLDASKRLASIQNKLIFMMWEDSTTFPFPVKVLDTNGRVVFVEDMFKNESINQLIWEHFIPVVVNESQYAELYNQIKDKRPDRYIDKFNDDSIKIMDVNGNIINTDIIYDQYLNMTAFIMKYYMDTSFLKVELDNYSKEQNVITSFRLASKYIDAAAIVNDEVRQEIIDLSNIYLKEAEQRLPNEDVENKAALQQKSELLKLLQDVILDKPKRVLRKLRKLEDTQIDSTNESLLALLYFTSYRLLKDEKNASLWRSKLSLVNLKKANTIITNVQ
ncbi:hypothetical protein [uncultured Psychroserpens sp.]|uniref:hypothetical protein n=1 Tax=uncultured Psychroserpens sp. TaxID=255436 RepID=UPI002614BE03|nr:hypothetical protein [uncultured Psychroserpens sp.]